MEVSSMIGSSKVNSNRINFGCIEVNWCKNSMKNNSKICIGDSINFPWKSYGVSAKASVNTNIKAVLSSENENAAATSRPSNTANRVRLYVGLPLNAVSNSNKIKNARAITAGLKALKLSGVDGVELPIWWEIVEKDDMGKYEWTSYLAITELVQKQGLKLHITLNFHASKMSKEFCESFKASFLSFIGSTITGISIGLGPDSELRYPSQHLYNLCKMIVPGIDLCDEHQKNEFLYSPQLLYEQITSSGKNLMGEEDKVVDLFTYQRMGAEFFSPDNFSSFTKFVRNLRQPKLRPDYRILERENIEALPCANGRN